jgi:hypothetical protein
MKLTHHGNCHYCGKRCKVTKDFQGTANLLDPDEKVRLEGEIAEQVLAWREAHIYCEDHEYKRES